MSDRIAGILLVIVAVLYTVEGWSFRATFFTDPLGARFVPIAVGLFLVVTSAVLAIRPTARIEWPHRRTWLALIVALVAFVAYAYLLEPFGFILATTIVFAVFAAIFRAGLWKGLLAGAVFSVSLYMIFAWALDLYLPTGDIFQGIF